MSDKLEKLDTRLKANEPWIGNVTFEPYVLASESLKIVKALNAAITRINELEAKVHNHTHGIEGGKHGPYIDRTTPPMLPLTAYLSAQSSRGYSSTTCAVIELA